MGALVVGLRYRRRAGVGVSSSRGGMRSSVNGTCGSIEIIDRVRKSSGVIMGIVRPEIDLAAMLKALSEDVKLDLKADLRLGSSRWLLAFFPVDTCGLSKALKSSSSMSISRADKGWSFEPFSLGGDETDRKRRTGNDLFPRK